MKQIYSIVGLLLLILSSSTVNSQEGNETEKSNIQNYTPSKLLEVGKWDIKWFNNLYTQNKIVNGNGIKEDRSRANFFNTSLEVFTGTTESKWLNVGVIAEVRSNTFADRSPLSVFKFGNDVGLGRAGIGHIAPSVKVAPFKSINNFSFQSSFFIPLHSEESNANGYLAENSYIWQNRFFYDYTFPGDKFQLFGELGTRLFVGEEKEGYANNSIDIAPGVFFSYFPSSKFTALVFIQHAQLLSFNEGYERDFTSAGFGAKYQLTDAVNIEALYSNFLRAATIPMSEVGLGQSFNLGLRIIL